MRRTLAALTLFTAHAANIASELEAFVDAAAAPAQTAQSAAPARTAPTSDRVVFVKTYKTGSTTVSEFLAQIGYCLLYTSPSPRDRQKSRMPSSA